MDAVNCFVMGEMSLEEAMLSTRGSDPIRAFVTWRDGDMILGIQERDAAPVFTRIPVGAGARLGAAATRLFYALDALPPRETLAGQQPPFPTTAFPVPNVRPDLVGALATLAKEAMTHADR